MTPLRRLVTDSVRRVLSFEDPKQTPAGIAAVYVNGQLTVKDGKATGTRAGRVLRRK